MTQIRKGQEFLKGELVTLDGYGRKCVVEVVGQSGGNRLFTSVKSLDPNVDDATIWNVMTRRLTKINQ